MALRRVCKYCGASISIRQMPAGQWVAFDVGTDEVHECFRRGEPGRRPGVPVQPPKDPVRPATTARPAHPAAVPGGQAAATAGSPATTPKAIRRLLEQAIPRRRCLRLLYLTKTHELTDRVVEPLMTKSRQDGHLVLRAYCRTRQDVLNFRVSRIKRAELLDDVYERPSTGTHEGPSRALPHQATAVAVTPKAIRDLVDRAIGERRCLRMVYYTESRNAVTDRVVEPAVKCKRGGRLMLEAFCRWRQEWRIFRLSRIRRAELLNETFIPKPVPGKSSSSYRPHRHVSGYDAPRPAGPQSPDAGPLLGCLVWAGLALLLWWLLTR
jgi:predicted DNA-binding transcriptional regulator YafY